MSKLTLSDITNLDNPSSINTINNNSQAIETAFDNTLSRDGTAPNQMGANFDMNGYRILNLPKPIAALDAIRLQDLIAINGQINVVAIPPGGLAGQFLDKNSNADYDVGWATAVTSVGLSLPADFTVTNSPVNTSTGTLTATWAVTPTGTGAVVRATNPTVSGGTFSSPSITLATITSSTINGVTINTSPGSVIAITTGKTITFNNSLTFAGTDATTLTFQGSDTYVGRNTTDTLTNKTLTTPVIGSGGLTMTGTVSGTQVFRGPSAASGTITLPAGTYSVVGDTLTQTLFSKSISAGGLTFLGTSGSTVLAASATASGTLTLPAATDTLIGKATTDTLSNKTISGASNTLSSLALGSLNTQAAYTLLGNFLGASASPTASAISGLTQKPTPAGSDLLLIQDQAASGQLKYATVSSVAPVTSVGALTGVVGIGAGLSTSGNNIVLNNGFFSVDRNGTNQTGLTAAAESKVQFTNKVKDTNTWFDATTNYRFTPQVAGHYQITLSVASSNGTSGETCQAVIYKNGVAAKRSNYLSATSAGGFIIEVIATLPFNGSTDYIEGFVYMPVGQTTLFGYTGQTFMSGFRVGDL